MIRFLFNLVFCIITAGIVGLYVFSRIKNKISPDGWVFRSSGMIEEIIGSIIFLIIVFIMIKPSIKIADNIARLPATDTEPEHLRIKFVNCSLYKAFDLHVDIYSMKRISISGDDVRSDRLGTFDGFEKGPPYLQSAFKAIKDDTKRNAAQVRVTSLVTDEAAFLHTLSSDNSFIELHVSIRHGLSGLQGHYIKRFHNTSCIKSGIYGHGFDTKINS